jgi:rubrerythrin
MSRLFDAIAYAERVHAINHARNLGYIGSTSDNIQAGYDGEDFEIEEMYPAYNAIATLQNEEGAKRSIHYAEEAEKIHRTYYADAKKTIDTGKDLNIGNVYICPVCGWTHIGDDLPGECPVCKAKKEKFVKF